MTHILYPFPSDLARELLTVDPDLLAEASDGHYLGSSPEFRKAAARESGAELAGRDGLKVFELVTAAVGDSIHTLFAAADEARLRERATVLAVMAL